MISGIQLFNAYTTQRAAGQPASSEAPAGQGPTETVVISAAAPASPGSPVPAAPLACTGEQTATRVAASLSGLPGAWVAKYIDHTLLKPEATPNDIRKLCAEAREYGFASVCVNPSQVKLAARELKGSEVKVCTVIGFPLGATTTKSKAAETRDAVANGAQEIDMVINIGQLKAGLAEGAPFNEQFAARQFVLNDVKSVVNAADGRPVKVILETGALTDREKVLACQLSQAAGASFVKTSTGFGPGGATVEDIMLMRRTVGPDMGIKASGKVGDLETAMKMIAAGATRIGASKGIAIVHGGDPAKPVTQTPAQAACAPGSSPGGPASSGGVSSGGAY